MAKSRVWKPSAEDRIDWCHPYIQMTRKVPGYLVQELHGFADTTWEKKLGEKETKDLVVYINRKPWIPIEFVNQLCRATLELDDGRDETNRG